MKAETILPGPFVVVWYFSVSIYGISSIPRSKPLIAPLPDLPLLPPPESRRPLPLPLPIPSLNGIEKTPELYVIFPFPSMILHSVQFMGRTLRKKLGRHRRIAILMLEYKMLLYCRPVSTDSFWTIPNPSYPKSLRCARCVLDWNRPERIGGDGT